jgi:hypothetical protein
MTRQMMAIAMTSVATLVAFAASVSAGPGMKRNIVGVIASVERNSPPVLKIVPAKGHEAIEVRTDAKTQYVKWITQREVQRGNHADANMLVAGRCVDVEPWTGSPNSAKVVRISDEPAGTVFDPCRDRR